MIKNFFNYFRLINIILIYLADKVFDAKYDNGSIYDNIAHNIVLSALKGINGTVFAYGQTSSGK